MVVAFVKTLKFRNLGVDKDKQCEISHLYSDDTPEISFTDTPREGIVALS